MIKKICVVCGKEFFAKAEHAKYCSSACRESSRWDSSLEEIQEKASKDKKRAVELYDTTHTTSEISKITGRSVSFVYHAWREAGLPKRPTPLQRQVKKLREKNLCCSEIADSLGKPTKTIMQAAIAIGMPFSENEKQKSKRIGWDKQKRLKKTEQILEQELFEYCGDKFSYVSGYDGSDGKITIKCNDCGEVFERSWITIRHHKNIICPSCKEQEKKKREEELKKEQERIKQERADRRAARLKEREQKRLALIREVTCAVCGKTFTTTRRNVVCCSPECSRKNAYRRKDRRITRDKRIDKGITAMALYKRDRGVCWICGEKCDPDDYIVRNGTIICGNDYPSVDHVIPICEGGTDSWDNVKLAHRGCNSVRYWRDHA